MKLTSPTLFLRLDAIARRYVWSRGLTLVGWSWCGLALLAWALQSSWPMSPAARTLWWVVLPGTATLILCAIVATAQRRRPSHQEIARQIEERAPETDLRLLTAVEQQPDPTTGRFSYLQQQLLTEATRCLHGDWPQQLIPTWRLTLSSSLILLDVLLLAALLLTGSSLSPTITQARVAPGSSTNDAPVVVEPGDVELERDSSLLIISRFRDDLPQRVQLEFQSTGQPREVLAMSKALDDPVFGVRLPTVSQDLTYRVSYDGQPTRDYRVTVFDLPTLLRSDIVVRHPEYTGKGEQRIPNAHDVTVVERSAVTLECRVNKPLANVQVVDQDNTAHAFTVDAQDPLLWRLTTTPAKSLRLKLALQDDRGRKNRDPDQFRIEVIPNQHPRLELAFPGKDVRVSPLEELQLEGRVLDDYGIDEFGLVMTVAGRGPQTIVLGGKVAGQQSQPISFLQALEDLQVAPDDLISYHLFATDRDADGQPRTVQGDLFFAEVRPFDETFRQMESPPGGAAQSGGQTPQGNQFEDLVKVQKEIVAATWNLIRNQVPSTADQQQNPLEVVETSQAENKSKLLNLMLHINGAAKQRAANQAVAQMTSATAHLQSAAEEESPATALTAAVAAEQAAYQLLLKLRAREHQVMQGQQSGGGSSGGASPSEQQLQELELSDQKNRYETQSAANSSAAQTEQQQDLGTLDRLKELARRQSDLNDKLRELDAALRLAQSPAEREEIERQLKRLRDEQQQLLQDADELRNRLAQSPRQEQMQETREQLENTRQRMVDATEKLEEGQLSQALSSTSRAERELNQLQQDFREQTSARFAETMRELRESARDLAQREQQLAQELSGQTPAEQKPTLRGDTTRQDLQDQFQQQQTAVEELLNRARQVVQEAENAEPLLSQQLYETLRRTREDKLEPALQAIPQLLQRGFVPEAQQAEEQARQGLERLQAGVDQAAESVLGSEVDALKRAKLELAELSQQLQSELQQSQPGQGERKGNAPGSENPENATPSQSGGTRPAENGQPSSQPGTAGNPAPGENPNSPMTAAPGSGAGESPAPMNSPSGSSPAGESPGSGNEPGNSSRNGSAPGMGSGGETPGDSNPPGGQPGSSGRTGNNPGGRNSQSGGQERSGLGGGPGGQGGPISGDGYSEWADRLREVETLVADPQLQADVSKLREQARSLRAEFRRHSESPNWDLVKSSLYEPMIELQRKVTEEVAKRESDDALVPIDRDPVPTKYKTLVRSYYERLGRGADE